MDVFFFFLTKRFKIKMDGDKSLTIEEPKPAGNLLKTPLFTLLKPHRS